MSQWTIIDNAQIMAKFLHTAHHIFTTAYWTRQSKFKPKKLMYVITRLWACICVLHKTTYESMEVQKMCVNVVTVFYTEELTAFGRGILKAHPAAFIY